ncbi:MAG: DUF3310 domain-containing protein [Methanobrevibacter sp.]|jgi:hypothetical protein|nr:DUF3310 domain-containing protein [Candidatus Methanoflexus mossambicus]
MKEINNYNIGNSDYSKHKFQIWDIIVYYRLNFFEGNMLKYLLRKKNDKQEDYKKIRHYIEKSYEILKINSSFLNHKLRIRSGDEQNIMIYDILLDYNNLSNFETQILNLILNFYYIQTHKEYNNNLNEILRYINLLIKE